MDDRKMIYFVGAGSGAADLITVRGMRLLQEADVVVWAGSLVNAELLSYCKPECQIHDSARLSLEETDEILQKAFREGKKCVRLHTGDPAIYGAIREQMEALDKAGIPYEVVPGVSSMFAAAASLKKEFTVPGVSQTLIVSRMEGRTPVPEKEKIRSLAAHGATMVLFLSSGMIPALVDELLAGAAYTKETPCALVYKASWPDEKIIRGNLGDIADKAAQAGIKKTALVLVGDFLGDRYELSRLYDKHFSTEFRKDDDLSPEKNSPHTADSAIFTASGKALSFDRVSLICFTQKGAELAEKIRNCIKESFAKSEKRSLSSQTVHVISCFGETHPALHDICADCLPRHRAEKGCSLFLWARLALRSGQSHLLCRVRQVIPLWSVWMKADAL